MDQAIAEVERAFTTRPGTLDHILGIGDKHFADARAFMDKRLADDVVPFSAGKGTESTNSRRASPMAPATRAPPTS